MLQIVSAGIVALIHITLVLITLGMVAIFGAFAQAFFTYLVIPFGSTWPIWLIVFVALGAIHYEK